jgi:hypothetical protein
MEWLQQGSVSHVVASMLVPADAKSWRDPKNCAAMYL